MKDSELTLEAAREVYRWANAINARAARTMRRSQLEDIRQSVLTALSALRFKSSAGSRFRDLLSDIPVVTSKAAGDARVEAYLRAVGAYLEAQSRSRDPLNWRGHLASRTFGRELALPRHAWPRGFEVR